jgi:nucleotide-binding universal stress UspA family protein
MGHTIVIAVEPGTAQRVARVGGELALRLDARAVLAHVQVEAPFFSARGDRERDRHQRERRGRAVAHAASAALPAGVVAEERVALGGVVSGLAEIAEDEEATLIVAGCRGRGALATALLGSTSRALPSAAPCPVMIVPPAPVDRPRPFDGAGGELPTMVAGMDGSTEASAAVRFAESLAAAMDHRLVVVQLREDAGSRASALQGISESEDARMIVIAAEQRNGRRLGLRSLAARLPRLATCPVTVVPHGTPTALAD